MYMSREKFVVLLILLASALWYREFAMVVSLVVILVGSFTEALHRRNDFQNERQYSSSYS